MKKALTFLTGVFISFLILSCQLHATGQITSHHPFYIGVLGGYGSTTWEGLVPAKKSQNEAMMMSTPIRISEGGNIWGIVAGFEFIPFFAIEGNYTHYPDSTVHFDSMSIFSFKNDERSFFITKTETISLMGKVMMPVSDTHFKIFSSAGAARTHRNDMLLDNWRLTPTFGAGLNYRLSDRLMGELAGNYTAGFGESQLEPTNTYFPFLYSVSLRLAYFF